MNINNGGFPPIQYVEIKKDITDNNLKKERSYAPLPMKKLDIKHILSLSVKNKMVDMNQRKINVLDSL